LPRRRWKIVSVKRRKSFNIEFAGNTDFRRVEQERVPWLPQKNHGSGGIFVYTLRNAGGIGAETMPIFSHVSRDALGGPARPA
jgi:hypothetical protein